MPKTRKTVPWIVALGALLVLCPLVAAAENAGPEEASSGRAQAAAAPDRMPEVATVILVAPGPGPENPNTVKAFDTSGQFTGATNFDAYPTFNGYGTRIALGNTGTSASFSEIITGLGPGPYHPCTVKGFDAYGTMLSTIYFPAYGVQKFGVNVACGDIDRDGFDEIITGPGPGEVFGPNVRGWNVDSAQAVPMTTVNFLAYGTNKYGVNVACGDIDGDFYDEVVTGAGPGAVFGPHVRGWNVDGDYAEAISAVSFMAYGTYKYGVNVACADIDRDLIDEILTGAGPGTIFGPHVRAWNYDGETLTPISGVSFLAYGTNQYGVRVTGGDVDNDGYAEIITVPGPGPQFAAHVRGWNYDDDVLTAIPSISFFAFDTSLLFGGDVAVGRIDF